MYCVMYVNLLRMAAYASVSVTQTLHAVALSEIYPKTNPGTYPVLTLCDDSRSRLALTQS